MSDIIPFNFNEIRLKEACWIDGKPYFTRRAIGEWLGYANPIQAITKIVERNPHIKQFSTVPKLGTVEGGREVLRDVEVYDPVGFQLIVNKSNQPRALQFQIAVAHLVVAFSSGKLHRPPENIALLAARQAYVRGNGDAVIETAKTERRYSDCVPAEKKGQPGVAPTTVYRRVRRARNCEPLNKRAPGFRRYIWKRHKSALATFLDLKSQGRNGIEIAEKTDLPRSTVYNWMNKFKE